MMFHLDDLESDFSRFHRVDDIWKMNGPRFFRLAWRIEAYGGVMAFRRQEQIVPEHANPVATPKAANKTVSLTEFMLRVPGAVELAKVKAEA